MSLLQKILFTVGFILLLIWIAQMAPNPSKPRKNLTLGSIETLLGGMSITLIGLSAFYDDDYILPGLALLVIGIPMTLAYTIEKYRQRSP